MSGPSPAEPAPLSRWRSLETHLALAGALLIAAAVALSVVVVTGTVTRHDERLVLDQSLAQTRRLAGFLSARLVNLQLSLQAAGARLERTTAEDAARVLTENSALTSQVHTLFVADASGTVLAMWDAENGVHHPVLRIGDRPYFQRTIAQQVPVISEPMTGRHSSEPVVVLTMPLRGNDGRLRAVLCGGVRLAHQQWLPRLLSSDENDPAIIVVADAQGRILAHPDSVWLLRDVAHEPGLSGAADRWVAQGRPAEPEGDAASFDTHLVAWAGVPDADWVVFRSLPASAALAGTRQAQHEALWLGLVIALAGGVALMTITFRLLRPLRRLERSALAVMDGADEATLDWPRDGGEIGRLTAALRKALGERQQSEHEGRRLTARLQAVRENAPVGFAISRARCYDLVSTHFERLLGYPPGALDGLATRTIFASDADFDALGPRVGAAFAQRVPFDEELEFTRRDGEHFWGRLRGQPVDWNDASVGTIWTLEDVSRERADREALAWSSSHDTLTRLANRAAFDRALDAALAERRGQPTSALFIDLDRFKAINDSAGHAAGDAMLRAVATALQAQVRNKDLVARVGGDEFAVLLSACDRHGARTVAEKMREAVSALRVCWAEGELEVGASIGVVEIDSTLQDLAAVMAAADQACYAAKRSGRDCVRVHGEPMLRVV